MRLVLAFLAFLAFQFNASLAVAQPSRVPGPELVTCTATTGYHCSNSGGGCKPDRVYAVTFTVDHTSGTIVDSDGNIYKILLSAPSSLVEISDQIPGSPFEYAIQATAQVGLAATETIVIGERSFVSSNVSVVPPRAYVQVGTCSGLRRP